MTVTGPVHRQARVKNQDALLLRNSRRLWAAVVSDGMGSRPHARLGALAACRAAWETVRELSFDADDRVVIHGVYSTWLKIVRRQGVSPADAGATCLVAWGMPGGEFRVLQLGDGLVVARPELAQPLVGRGQSGFSNETTGLGLARHYADWQCTHGLLSEPGDGLLLMTDGISEDLERTEGLVAAVTASVRGVGVRAGKMRLKHELEQWPTPRHGDDKTVAVVFRR